MLRLQATNLFSRGDHIGYKVGVTLGRNPVTIWPSDCAEQEQCITCVPPRWLDDAIYGCELDVLSAEWSTIGYKLVGKERNSYFSLWAGFEVEYELGITMREEALLGRNGGLYVCQSPDAAMRLLNMPVGPKGLHNTEYALLLCACSGPYIQYANGKAACSCLTPIKEIPLPGYGDFSTRIGPQRSSVKMAHRAHYLKSRPVPMLRGWGVLGFAILTSEPSDGNQRICGSLDVWPSPSSMLNVTAMSNQSNLKSKSLALLWCACGGPFFEVEDGSICFTRLAILGRGSLPDSSASR